MSDDYHRPTLTFPNGAYNASQVRLYGIPGHRSVVYPGSPGATGTKEINVSIKVSTGDRQKDEEAHHEIKEFMIRKKDGRSITDIDIFEEEMSSGNFPFPWPVGASCQLKIDMRKLGNVILSTIIMFDEVFEKGRSLSSGVIVGYSYEGHCYSMPRPKIMLIPSFPLPIPRDDCGFDKKFDYNNPSDPENYRLWIVDKLDECVELEMNQGFVEQLVLDANLPGKRSPTMYASRMQMGHRSGRLTDS